VPAGDAGAKGAGSVAGFTASGAGLALRLTPLRADPAQAALEDAELSRRFGAAGLQAFRLELALGAESAPLELAGLCVQDAAGQALAPSVARPGETDPVAALFGSLPERLTPGLEQQVVLLGRAPGADARLFLPGSGLELSLQRAEFAADDLPEALVTLPADGARGELGSAAHARAPGSGEPGSGEPGEAAAEIARLQRELLQERTARQRRELEWIQYQRLLATLAPGADVPRFEAEGEAAAGQEAASAPTPEPEPPDPARVRDEEILVALRTLLRLEHVDGLDLLEGGALGGEPGAQWTGPVVFRLLDDRGRLAGGLSAARLRLEASRAARTLTLVLEDGFESHGDERTPFDERRIGLPFVDPSGWLERVPELFPAEGVDAPEDDGLWALEAVRRELNRLLALDTSTGWYRVRALGGVAGDELLDVQLEAFDADGRLERRFFADRLRVRVEEQGVLLQLCDGAIVRGEQKTAFLNGEHRLVLPNASGELWSAAQIPGVSAPLPRPASEAGAEAAALARGQR
jgi:hypothetical protein